MRPTLGKYLYLGIKSIDWYQFPSPLDFAFNFPMIHCCVVGEYVPQRVDSGGPHVLRDCALSRAVRCPDRGGSEAVGPAPPPRLPPDGGRWSYTLGCLPFRPSAPSRRFSPHELILYKFNQTRDKNGLSPF